MDEAWQLVWQQLPIHVLPCPEQILPDWVGIKSGEKSCLWESQAQFHEVLLARSLRVVTCKVHVLACESNGAIVQIRLFYPELLHAAFVIIRSIVKDSTDNEIGDSAVVFLDSDGLVCTHAQIN